ncbi:hypothetical protein [Stratiformator vulcanicus]|uniref:SLA1 homology domain-containing protein n=1 Tax=Stratiformator vulcanicus TaxID=2527980 RepID=A0A517R325_9PLAN|nr:hypothetical protein [Stratiformator vulcanicus]QDT38288.1 hypothetical protein Pan189_26790 [Stratiformator vulcanicus]
MGQQCSKLLRISVTGLAVVVFSAGIAAAQMRVWTDQSGNSVTAEFVSISRGKAVFKLMQGGTTSVALVDLVPSDQQEIVRQLSLKGIRAWTTADGQQMFGRLNQMRNGKVVLRIDSFTKTFDLSELSVADQMYALRESGLRVESSLESQLGERRTWNLQGREPFVGRLDRMLPDRNVLIEVDGMTWVDSVDSFSHEDHAYIYAVTDNPGIRSLVPGSFSPAELAAATGQAGGDFEEQTDLFGDTNGLSVNFPGDEDSIDDGSSGFDESDTSSESGEGFTESNATPRPPSTTVLTPNQVAPPQQYSPAAYQQPQASGGWFSGPNSYRNIGLLIFAVTAVVAFLLKGKM